MRNLIIFLLLFCCSLTAKSADTLVVVDASTGVPIRNVIVYLDYTASVSTTYDGKFLLNHKHFDELKLRHPAYLERIMLPEEIVSDTIRMLPKTKVLSEVVVIGEKKKKEFKLISPTDAQLLSNGSNQNGNLLGLIPVAYKLLFGEKHKTSQQEKTKKAVENY